MGRLEGKTALISGAASGMGRAQACLFAAEGACVGVADINDAQGRAVASEIESQGGSALFHRVDVTQGEHWRQAVTALERRFGPVSVLCNIAGANIRRPFDEQTETEWHFIVQTALTGAFLGIKAVIESMRRFGSGSIINMGSLATSQGGSNPAYVASKAGMHGLTISAAQAFAQDNIRCNLVSPGHVDTPFLRDNAPHSPNDETTSLDFPPNYARRLAATPLGRLVQPEDIAQAFLFLASDEAAMITGAHLKVDGGAGFSL